MAIRGKEEEAGYGADMVCGLLEEREIGKRSTWVKVVWCNGGTERMRQGKKMAVVKVVEARGVD